MYSLFFSYQTKEPFLITVLLKWGLSLTTIGLLISVEKITTYTFELPSGYLSDRCGARTTLCSCFILYIISFVCYYFGQVHIVLLILASFFYGLAEAMRSGAHKSMVFLWLEKHNLEAMKSYLNGKTRSFSLLGSAVAAIGGIFFSLYLDADRSIFLCSIPAYMLDLLVVYSYPSYMNTTTIRTTTTTTDDVTKKKKKKQKKSSKSSGFCEDMRALATVMKSPGPRRVVLTTAATGVFHRVFKDFIQPLVLQNKKLIVSTFGSELQSIVNTTVALDLNTTATAPSSHIQKDMETTQQIILGLSYCIFYLVSSPASQNAYRCPKLCGKKEKNCMDFILDGYASSLFIVAWSLYLTTPIVALFVYIVLYVLYNISKPLSASAISDVAGKRLRATVFSADAALQTILTAGLAPLAGYMVDNLSLEVMFLTFAVVLMVLNRFCIAEVSLVEACCGNGSDDVGEEKIDGAIADVVDEKKVELKQKI